MVVLAGAAVVVVVVALPVAAAWNAANLSAGLTGRKK